MTTRSPPCAPNVSRTTSAAWVDSLFGSLYPPSVSSPKTPSPQTPAPSTATSATVSTGHRKRATHDPQPANTMSPFVSVTKQNQCKVAASSATPPQPFPNACAVVQVRLIFAVLGARYVIV